MAYPFAGFSSFLYQNDERPVQDTHWKLAPSIQRSRALGSSRDSVTVLARGSDDRQFEDYLEPTRFASARALVGTTATLVDWDRPTPGQRPAFLLNIEEVERIGVVCTGGEVRTKIRARWIFISQ